MPTPRSTLGAAGERAARRHLEQQGFRWIESNWRCAAGEFDLVMWDHAELVFIEVKLRHGENAGRAEEGITAAKGRKLLAAGARYLQEHPDTGDPIWRVDLVAITLDRSGKVERLTHIENAVVTG
jgi:putative endonuclease